MEISSGQTNVYGWRPCHNTNRHKNWKSYAYSNYLVIRLPKLVIQLLCRARWTKNWNAQLSFDTAPEISQSARNWKCLLTWQEIFIWSWPLLTWSRKHHCISQYLFCWWDVNTIY